MSGNQLLVLRRRLGADALDVVHHGEAERVGVDAGIARVVEVRLEHHVGVRAQELHHGAVGQQPLLVQPVHDPVVHVGGAALVHQLGLLLRIEILRDDADDAQDLALPGLQARRGLLQEIQDVLLRQLQQRAAALLDRLVLAARRSLPGTVRHRSLNICSSCSRRSLLAQLLRAQIGGALARIAMHAVAHQRVRGIEQALDLPPRRSAPRSDAM